MMPTLSDVPRAEFYAWLGQLKQGAKIQGWRYLVVLSGDRAWSKALCAQCPELLAGDTVWVSAEAPAGARTVAVKQATTLLGQETANIVFDAWSGFHPNAFAALAGTIHAGGVLLLLTPRFADWPQLDDPDYQRMDVPGFARSERQRFLQYLVQRLQQDQRVLQVLPDAPLPALPQVADDAAPMASGPAQASADDVCLTREQAQAVSAIEHVVHGHRKRPLVLCADRGRGKTAALGIACARLLRQGISPILVTAPSVHNIAPLFERAAALLPGAKRCGLALSWQDGEIRYLAPDHLLAQHPAARLLLIDEAAAIPAPLLNNMLDHYQRLVFTTTIHGYEGTGRGFALRFQDQLRRRMPQWRKMTLLAPVRWAVGDALEASVNDLLLLAAHTATGNTLTTEASAANSTLSNQVRSSSAEHLVGGCLAPHMEFLDRDRLLAEPELLVQLFELLMMAHYRTTPDDLRLLLDGPNMRVAVSVAQGRVVAVILFACEGGLEPELIDAIRCGARRPRGHLLPQTVFAQTGCDHLLTLLGWRIVRIAVHPALQRRGHGLALLRWMAEQAEGHGVSYLGSSFGATEALIAFWLGAGFTAVAIGSRRDAASGVHALAVLRPLSHVTDDIVDAERRRFAEVLPLALGDSLRELETEVIVALLRSLPQQYPLKQRDEDDVSAFAAGCRSYQSCYAGLWRAALSMLAMAAGEAGGLNDDQARLLVTKLLQHDDWARAAARNGLSGQAQVVNALRRTFAGWSSGRN